MITSERSVSQHDFAKARNRKSQVTNIRAAATCTSIKRSLPSLVPVLFHDEFCLSKRSVIWRARSLIDGSFARSCIFCVAWPAPCCQASDRTYRHIASILPICNCTATNPRRRLGGMAASPLPEVPMVRWWWARHCAKIMRQ